MFMKDNKRAQISAANTALSQYNLNYSLAQANYPKQSEQQTISLNRLIKSLVSSDLSEIHVYMHTDNYTSQLQQH